jgi:ABC-type nitrate/sulfonate/bicarbonate transport system permease component
MTTLHEGPEHQADLLLANAPSHSRAKASLRERNWPFWITLAALFALWHFGAKLLHQPLVIVPPKEVLDRGLELWNDGTLGPDMRTSGIEFITGFTGGALAGIGVGIISGNWPRIGRVINPFASGLYAVPLLALAPLFIISMGLGLASKALVVALAVFFSLLFTTSAGVAATESTYRELSRAFRLTELESMRKILLPSATPYILSGLRVATGKGLTAVLGAELFGARDGVGLLILQASASFDTAAVYVGIIIFAVAGITMTKFFYVLERRVAPWRHA